jgi:tetratricopeptide (TPR) repeat protein
MGKWQSKGFQYFILILSGLFAQLALVQMMGSVINLSLSYGFDPALTNLLSKFPFVTTALGEFVMRSQSEAINVTLAAVIRVVVMLVVLLMFYTDMESAYAAAFWILLADIGWGWLAVTQLHWMNLSTAQLNAGFAGLMILICLLAVLNRLGVRRREFVEIDRTLTNALAIYVRGRELARKGQWAAAAAHWGRAAALKPGEAAYAKDLALALDKLGRHDQALAALQRGHDHHPDDPEFKSLMDTVERQPAASPQSKTG